MIYRRCDVFPVEKDSEGIPANVAGEGVVPDVLVAPVLGWGAAGHRLGYGGGYFDRYLEAYDVETIGVSFEALEVPEALFNAHDRPLSMLISESRVRRFWCS